MRLGDHVIKLFDQAAQHHVGAVHQHLHATHGVRRCALLALGNSGHAGLLIGQLHRHLNDPGQLGLVAVELDSGERFAHVVDIVGGKPNLARAKLPLLVGRLDRSGLDDDLRPTGHASVVHHLSPCRIEHALLSAHEVWHTVTPHAVCHLLPDKEVVRQVAAFQRIEERFDHGVVDHHDASADAA